jgi:hypothetical protein
VKAKGYIAMPLILEKLAAIADPPEPEPEEPAGKQDVDLEGIAPESYADAMAGSPRQSDLDRYWERRRALGQ